MNPPVQIDGAVRLAHLGVIRARGADAVKFLQGQLTNDVALMPLTEARPAGFCSAKGRLQASFVTWKAAADEVLLLCSADVLPTTLKRLSMFVLRAQCKLTDASAEVAVWGVAGAAAHRWVESAEVWQKQPEGAAVVIRLPDAAGVRRALWIAEATVAPPAWSPIDLDAWRWLEVQSGVPTIEAATVEQFVPQMVNFELIGGVDFRKGCYPGQEVVARSQYRGTLKRRMFLFDLEAGLEGDGHVTLAAGQEVFHGDDPDQPAGRVVNAAPRPGGGSSSALVEVKLAALEAGRLHLGSAGGVVLRRAALPYAVPQDNVLPA